MNRRQNEKHFRLRLEVPGEPLTPFSAVIGAEGVHDILV